MEKQQTVAYFKTAELRPHPLNPRKDLGDLGELAASIKAAGVLQPLLVVPGEGGGWNIVAGHRRHAAAILAGAEAVPCVMAGLTEGQQLQAMLIENVLREGLTLLDEAEGFQLMLELGETVESAAKATGFTQKSIKDRLAITRYDRGKVKERVEKGATLFDFMELEKVTDEKARTKLLDMIGTQNFNWSLHAQTEKEEAARNKGRVAEYLKAAGLAPLPKGESAWKREQICSHEMRDALDTESMELDGASHYAFSGSWVTVYGDVLEQYKNGTEHGEAEKLREDRERRRTGLAGLCARMYGMRLGFVRALPKKDIEKNKAAVIGYAAIALAGAGGRCENEALAAALGVPHGDGAEPVDSEGMLADSGASPLSKLFAATYASLDRSRLDWHTGWGEVGHDPGGDAVYLFLEALGYMMSDEERAVVYGTHEFYDAPDEDEPGDEASFGEA